MKRLVVGILALFLAVTFVTPLQAQETQPPQTAQETAAAVGDSMAKAAAGEVTEAAGDAMQEVADEAEAAADDVYQAAEDAADDSEWLWILGLAGAFIIVWFLLRRKKARRQAS